MPQAPFICYDLRIEPLSPIHIGSGVTLEPMEYDLEENHSGCWMIVFDLPAMLRSLTGPERTEFDRIADKGDYPGLRTWVRRIGRQKSECRRFVVQVQEPAFKLLRTHQDDPERLGEIELMTRHADTGVPFVPGSSIKGAIRTALVDHALGEMRPERRPRGEKNGPAFEAKVLGHVRDGGRPDLYKDPLRQLAISDCMLSPGDCYIDRIQIINRRAQDDRRSADASGIQMHRDVTWSMLDGESIAARGSCRITTGLSGRGRQGAPLVADRIDLDRVIEACNAFYRPRLKDELDRFPIPEEGGEDLLKWVEEMGADQCLVRLGRHSHFECVTVSEPYARPPRRGVGASRSRVDGRLPLGWAKVRFSMSEPGAQ
ncbi:MAG: type III-A CRISPR-associated RAMP protein Csm5 [Phycisphaerales bacterium]|nr:type III-A CRISPR-associated RAMP protein Csm5 [Phycisphaerales bacterium]